MDDDITHETESRDPPFDADRPICAGDRQRSGRPVVELGCTCFRVRRAARRMTQSYDAALAPEGISIVTYAVLSVVARHGDLTLSSLAERLAIDRTTLSRTADRMKAAGLIEAAPCGDRRERRLRLSPRGAAILEAASARWSAKEAALEARLGPERLAVLKGLLAEVETIVEEDDPDADPSTRGDPTGLGPVGRGRRAPRVGPEDGAIARRDRGS